MLSLSLTEYFSSLAENEYVYVRMRAGVQRGLVFSIRETRRVEKLNISYTVGERSERRISRRGIESGSRVSRVVTRDWDKGNSEYGERIGDKMGFFVTMTGASSHVRFEG